uniref:BICRA like chromatin remodeling complex associated protein n=1 Tax=Cynoglossus semilaevis TaxID=244447 RepID=A0A3P8W3P9_CYNSE
MDDEDDRRLLDILGDVDALNDYLHGSNSKSIDEDDVTNAAYGSEGSFFASDTSGSNTGLKDGSMGGFGDDSASAGLQLSSSLSFIEDELVSGNSPGGVDLGGEDQPFDILQKSLLEADITEQTLVQEALLDAQPAPTLVQAPVPFSSQLVSGGYGGGVGVATTATSALPTSQFLQGVSQLPNGSTQHIQVLGSFGTSGGVMTLSSLERTPQIVLRPGAPVAAAGGTTGSQVFAPTQGQVGQVGLPFKNIPVQNIIIQRGPGGAQTLVRPIQPKPLQTGAHTLYSLGLQPTSTSMTNAGQNFTATPRGQLILNQGMVRGTQVGASVTQTWTGVSSSGSAHVQTSCAPGRLTLVGPSTTAVIGQSQVSASPVQRLLVTQNQNCASLSPLPGTVTQEQDFRQNSASPALQQVQLGSIHAVKTMSQDPNSQVSALKRPALQPLTRDGLFLHQLGKDHVGVQTPDRRRFTSVNDALQRLVSYHVFQGAPPSKEEFSQVDDVFEAVATQVLKKTEAMVNKYRRLLLVEAERSFPSSEMVMIDRTFNQEERSNLTQDKRMLLVDPDSFLEDFCCGTKSKLFQVQNPPQSSQSLTQLDRDSKEPTYRTDSPPDCEDPGGGELLGPGPANKLYSQHNKSVLELKRSQQHCGPSDSHTAANSYPQGNPLVGQTHYQGSHHTSSHPVQPQCPPQLSSPPHPDTDSALEAAVNSILEC